MVRRGRQSLNSSVITNVSVSEDDFSRLAERLSRTTTEIKLVGYHETIAAINNEIDALISGTGEPEFTLVTGPTGTGKTSFIRQFAKRKELSFFFLEANWTTEKRFGNPEAYIEKIFEEAALKSPSLIFIDDIHLICSDKRSEIRDRVFAVLLDELKSLKLQSARVLVYAATDKPELLDPQIRKYNYFSEEIKFSLPKKQDRIEILKHLTGENLTDEEVERLADACHCYSYVDFKKLCKITVKDNQGTLNYCTLKKSLGQFKPVAVKSITTPCPPLRWEDIGGVDAAKEELQSIMWPLKFRDKFLKLGIGSGKGAILYGPPGCSKTMLAKALATESGFNFICIKGPELYSKFVGDSEAAVRKLYRSAREIAPSIIFFDEIDGFTPNRSDSQSSSVGDKVVTQLLAELDGIEPLHNVYTIAATNRPDRVDAALLRPGRLDPAIYIPLPSENDRVEIFKVHMRPLALHFDEPIETIIDGLASKTNGYSGAEIAKVCQVAGKLSLKENIDTEAIELRHFDEALKVVRPKTKAEQLKVYEDFQQEAPLLLEQQKLNDEESKVNGRIHRDSLELNMETRKGETKKRSLLNRLRRSLRYR